MRRSEWLGRKKTRWTPCDGVSSFEGVETCPECNSSNTTIHRNGELHCRHCGVQIPPEELSEMEVSDE